MLQQHHKEADGYRGMAILLVVFYHYFDGLKIFRWGWTGVDLFFILTGFLVTGRLLETYAPQQRWAGFWKNRALKILPPLLLLLLIYFLLMPAIATPAIAHDIRLNSEYKWWYFSFSQNWLFVRDGYPVVPHLAFLWSLSVQVQFYILLFLIVWIVRNPRTLMITFTVIGLAAATVRTNMAFETMDGSFAHYMYNSFLRMDTFAGGVILYCLLALDKVKRSPAILLFAVCALLLIAIGVARRGFDFGDPVAAGPGIFLFVPVAAALLYFMFMKEPAWMGKIARFRLFTFPGEISYSLYLFHIPVFLFLSGRLYGMLTNITGAGLMSETLAAVICLFISFAVAWCVTRFIERPVLKYKDNKVQA